MCSGLCSGCVAGPCAVPGADLFGGGLWIDMDFLLWWRDRRVFPTLVTTQPNDGVVPGATVLFGGPQDESARPGGRLEFGVWLDPCQRTAVGARYLAVADASISPEYTSSDIAFVARPFLDVSTVPSTPTAFPVVNAFAQPPTSGRLGFRTDSEIQAGDVFFLWTLRRSPCASFGFLAGYQFARIDEDLLIESFTRYPQSSVGFSPNPLRSRTCSMLKTSSKAGILDCAAITVADGSVSNCWANSALATCGKASSSPVRRPARTPAARPTRGLGFVGPGVDQRRPVRARQVLVHERGGSQVGILPRRTAEAVARLFVDVLEQRRPSRFRD